MDKTHVGLNTVIRDAFRVELDWDFTSYEVLLRSLQSMVESGILPCLPHIAVWIPCASKRFGTVNRPHLWFFLPEKKGVFGRGNKSDRLLKGVMAAVTDALSVLGADPGGLANPHDGKNPLSPHSQYRVPNEDVLPRLKEYADIMDVTLDDETMARLMSIRKLDRTKVGTRSNQVYDWAYQTATLLARELYLKRIVDVTAVDFDRYRFGEIIECEMHARAKVEFSEFAGDELQALLDCCSARATWAAEKFDAISMQGGVNRGAARDQIEPDADLATRQAAGGAYARATVMGKSIKAIAKAMLPDVKADKVSIGVQI